jgi:hypothetical protein
MTSPTPPHHDIRSLLDGLPVRYRLQRLLGAGGFGAVYLATDEVLQRDVAIKVLDRGESNDRGDRETLRREARALAAVSQANIVQVLDVLELPRADALVLEYVPGGTLGSVLETGIVPPREQALRWITGVAAALSAVHAAGLLHCDLKPDNVLIDASGQARLTDFGVARWAHDPDATASGSLGYAAPEVMLGDPPSAASDVYSLGVVAWELMTGRRAFEDARTIDVLRRQTTAALPSLANVATDLPAEVRDVLARCLEADPADRPASASEVRDVLARCTPTDLSARALDGLGITVVVPMLILTGLLVVLLFTWIEASDLASPTERSPLRLFRRRYLIMAEGALVAIATVGLFISAAVSAVRLLMRSSQGDAPIGVMTVLRRVFAAPPWWPTWYPGRETPADVRRLPDQIRNFRVVLWWGLPLVFTVVAYVLVLALGRPPVVGLVVARVAVGAALLTFFVAAALLVDIVVTYRESPMYDAFELAAIAIARPVRGDVARALPLAFSEQRTADENPSGRRWFRSWTQDDEGEHPRVAQSSVAIVTKAVGLGVFGVVVVAWLVRVVSQNAGGRWSDTLSRLFD